MLPDTDKLKYKLYTRRELQHFCQQFGIKANGKNEEMYTALLQKTLLIHDEQLQQIRQNQASAELKMSVSLAKSYFDEEPQTEQVEANEAEVVDITVSYPRLVMRLCESDSTSRSQQSCDNTSHNVCGPYSPAKSNVYVFEGHENCQALVQLIEEYRQQAKQLLKQNLDRKMRQFLRQSQSEVMVIPQQKRFENIEVQACACDSTDVLKNLTAKLDTLLRK